jgi:tRNA-2-methylthio-N6-dimethylallyladenosine synthase
MKDHVPEEVKAERLERLQALLFAQQTAFQQSLVGRTVDVLVEKPGRLADQVVGRSPWLLPVIIDAKDTRIGEIISARITKAGTNSLHAEPA